MIKDIQKYFRQKHGVELSLTLIVEFIIAIVVLIVLIIFFTGGFSENWTSFLGIGEGGIENARDSFE
ncbi:MAG: hypothetical protein LAT82_03445 [Nanoarchaeota archaeon]|nr:hypothetical protein [Nanoarchaeota archaeon]